MRAGMLDDLTHEVQTAEQKEGGLADLASELMRHPEDGRVKMYVLNEEPGYPGVISTCSRTVSTPRSRARAQKDHVVAFSKAERDDRALVVVRASSRSWVPGHGLQDPQGVWGRDEATHRRRAPEQVHRSCSQASASRQSLEARTGGSTSAAS